MASEETALALSHRLNNNHDQMLFQNNSNKTTRELTGFIDHRYYHASELRQTIYNPRHGIHNCHVSPNGSDSNDDDDDEDDDVERLVSNTSSDKDVKLNHLSSFGKISFCHIDVKIEIEAQTP